MITFKCCICACTTLVLINSLIGEDSYKNRENNIKHLHSIIQRMFYEIFLNYIKNTIQYYLKKVD